MINNIAGQFISEGKCCEACAECLAYQDVVLNTQIGHLLPGSKINSIWFMWDKAIVEVYEFSTSEEPLIFPLKLRVE